MPTQIIDGFRLSAATPIDTRMVTTGLASRNALQYKYEGLRVFDTVDKKAYVWIDSAWQEETLGGGGGGGASINSAITGAQNFISKFTTSGLAESVIREQLIGAEYFVGIGIATAPTRRLEVGGTVKATKFEGALDGADLGIQSVNVNKLVGGPSSGTYLLKSVNGTNAWVAEQTSASTVSVTLDNTFTKGYLVYSTSTGAGVGLYANSVSTDRSVGIKPDTVQLLASSDATNDKTAPGYSFSGQTNTGLLGNSTSIELSFKGVSRFVANNSSASLLDTSGTERIKATTSGAEVIGTTTLSSTLTVSGATTLNSSATIAGYVQANNTLTVADLLTANGTVRVNGPLIVTSGTPKKGRVLKSTNSVGNAYWSPPGDVGTIMIWSFGEATIPAGWLACKSAIVNNEEGSYKIYLSGYYFDVPTMCDDSYSIVTGVNYSSGGTRNPRSPSTNTFTIQEANLPKHTHGAGTLQPLAKGLNANGDTYIQFPWDRAYHPSYTSGMRNNAKVDPVEGLSMDWTGQFNNGTLKWDLGISGNTSDGGFANSAISITTQPERYVTVLFIIKYDPDAAVDTDGYVYFVPY